MSSLKKFPALESFLTNSLSEGDLEQDSSITRDFAENSAPSLRSQVMVQLDQLLGTDTLVLEDIGIASNRWFGEEAEAREWLQSLRAVFAEFEGAAAGSEALVVKDSNGTVLAEGDSVIVIKDLKVKGGSSDLKRGTMVRKIHLIDDPDVIECRVDGSTLVLKTCFLKKA